MKKYAYTVLAVVGVLIFVFCLNYFGWVSFRFFAPKYENARREVFENTQSYVEGKRQSLVKHYSEWRKSGGDEKTAIRALVLQEFANFDVELFTPQQKKWYLEITN